MRYLLFLPASIAMTLLAMLLALLLPFFAVQREGQCNNAGHVAVEPRLPDWLVWFGTPDNSLLGDDGHQARWGYVGGYWQAVAWCLRNPAYGFDWSVLAVEPVEPLKFTGNPWIKNRDNAVAGSTFITCQNAWCYKVVRPLWGDTAFMGEFGWRLTPWAQGRGSGKAMFVFSLRLTAFNP